METISLLRVMVRGLGEAGRYPSVSYCYRTSYVSLGANTQHQLSRVFLGSYSARIWFRKN